MQEYVYLKDNNQGLGLIAFTYFYDLTLILADCYGVMLQQFLLWILKELFFAFIDDLKKNTIF